MRTNLLGAAAAALALGLVAAGTGAGCGSFSASSLCDDICACQHCTEHDRTTCVFDADKAESDADKLGCSSELSALVACDKTSVTCEGDVASASGCDAEESAFAACSRGGNIVLLGADPCKRAAAHLTLCLDLMNTTSSSSGGPVECTGQSLCASSCINAADCAAIKDAFNGTPSQASQAFLDCTSTCATTP